MESMPAVYRICRLCSSESRWNQGFRMIFNILREPYINPSLLFSGRRGRRFKSCRIDCIRIAVRKRGNPWQRQLQRLLCRKLLKLIFCHSVWKTAVSGGVTKNVTKNQNRYVTPRDSSSKSSGVSFIQNLYFFRRYLYCQGWIRFYQAVDDALVKYCI